MFLAGFFPFIYRKARLQHSQITNATDNNEFKVGVFIDLKKAFDTINHEILLDELGRYGKSYFELHFEIIN